MVEMIKNWIETSEKLLKFNNQYDYLARVGHNGCFQDLGTFEYCGHIRKTMQDFIPYGELNSVSFFSADNSVCLLLIIFLWCGNFYLFLKSRKSIYKIINNCFIFFIVVFIVSWGSYTIYIQHFKEDVREKFIKVTNIIPFTGEYSNYEILLKKTLNAEDFFKYVVIPHSHTTEYIGMWDFEELGVKQIPNLLKKISDRKIQ